MKEYQIICIDDDEHFLGSMESALPGKVERLCRQFKCVFDFVTGPDELFEILSSCGEDGISPTMVISDQVMPEINGIELIEKVKAAYPDMVCVLLTGHAGLDSAKYAINQHLLDQYATKPIEDIYEFASLVANLLKRYHMDMEERERTTQLARTVEELRISNEHIKAMHTAAEQVAMLSKSLKSVDFDEVVQLLSDEVPRIFQAESGVLCFPAEDCEARIIHRRNCPCSDEALQKRVGVKQAFQDSQVLCDDVPCACGRLAERSPDVVIPLAFAGLSQKDADGRKENWGYLCLCGIDPVAKSSPDLVKYKAGLIKDIMSANLTNARLYQQARRDSRIDLLTNVYARRALEEELESEYGRAVRYKHPFCVAIADVDRFKEINDNFGHTAGDQALRELASILQGQKREVDVLARYGGDEFIVLMPETELADAATTVKRMRKEVESALAIHSEPVTISCGVAEWSGSPGETAADVLRRADAALYRAKRAGRNRVVAAPVAKTAVPSREAKRSG